MKRKNNKNIITSDDVTILGENLKSRYGETLENVLEKISETQDSLKSNVKWLYKYGGVGGKGGGGGSDSPTFSDKWFGEVILIPNGSDSEVVPLVDSATTSDNYSTAMFKSANRIKIIIKQPYGQEFKAKIYYGGKYIESILFNKTEGYSKDFNNINIRENGNLEVEISDTASITDPKKYALKCICDAYDFQDQILYGNGIEILKSSRGIYVSFMDDILGRDNIRYNLQATTYYKFPLKIVYTTIDGFQDSIIFNEDSSRIYNKEKLFTDGGLPIIHDVQSFLYTNGEIDYEKAGTYIFNIKKYIVTSETDDLIEDTDFLIDVVPSTLYLSIQPRYEGRFKIYNDTLEQNPEYTYIGNKDFSLTPYNGKASDGSQVFLKISVNGIYYQYSGNSIISVTVRETIYPSLRIMLDEQHDEGWVPIIFEVCPDSQFDSHNTKIFTRYLMVRKYDQTIGWYFKSDAEGSGFNAKGTHYRFGEISSSYSFKTQYNHTLDGNDIISRSNSDDDILVITSSNFAENLTSADVQDCMINIGIQYNDINNDTTPLMKITTSEGSSNFSSLQNYDFLIYQNSIQYGSSPIGYADVTEQGTNYISGFFIGKEVDYNTSDMSKYQLITITRRCVKEQLGEGEEMQGSYEIAVYINGILQTCKQGYELTTPVYSKFLLNNCNYSINLLDIQYLNAGSISDASVVKYWYAFNSNIQENLENLQLKESLLDTFHKEFIREVDSNNKINGRVKLSDSGFLTLCGLDNVPIMLMFSDSTAYNGESFMDWSDRWRDANKPLEPTDYRNVSVFWKPKSATFIDKDDIRPTIVPTIDTDAILGKQDGDGVINGQFKLTVQGSTTRTYKSKNYTITLDGKSSKSEKFIGIFTPKFEQVVDSDSNEVKKRKYAQSLLPENSFTLKADVVDSSHTNNTCMGSFINDVSTKFNLAGAQTGKYVGYIKNCLQGFPFLLFVKETKTDEYYYLGIYNFNLGRDSYFNLGYVDIGLLDNFDIQDNFNEIYFVSKEKYDNVRKNFISAEVQDNKAEFDFSQYDQSILFELDGGRDKRFMFDDFVPNKADLTQEKASISNFVKNISRAGGYIFEELCKGFVDEDTNVSSSAHPQYTKAHYVPQATQQWIKYEDNAGNILYRKKTDSQGNIIHENPFVIDDLINCIRSHEDYSQNIEEAYCDYTSLVEYYTLCMAFGLLDNVEKNLTIKTWNNKNGIGTYHLAFYDMDTCLGINNESGDVKYFAFSDYWGAIETKSPYTINVIGESRPQDVYVLDSIDILRDHTPNTVNQKDFFDTPSSYLFAIAKYAKSILTKKSSGFDTLVTPQDLWAYWRTTQKFDNIDTTVVGCLSSAQKFLDTYYLKYMEGINELMFNYNYRAKYFRENSDVDNVYDEQLKRFHGDRHNYVKDWLTKRFHILDAYFNLNRSIIPINDGDGIVNYGQRALYDEPTYSFESITFTGGLGNPDVQIARDIFSTDGASYDTPDMDNINSQLIVKAPDYTPLMIREGQSIVGRFLLNDDSKYYSIKFSGGGPSTRINFLGSTLWTYLHNINFMHSTCSINSRYLENLVGFSGAINSWNIQLPSLKVISLTSSNYSGTLTLNQNELKNGYFLLPNLTSVDISGSKISLDMDSGNVRTLTLDNINSTDLSIKNCTSLTSVSCNNIKVSGTCNLEISWSPNFTLTNSGIRNLTITSRTQTYGTLNISNDQIMERLTSNNFKNIRIDRCYELNTFKSPSSNVESINITECTKLESVEINITSCKSLIINNCNLSTIILYANSEQDFNNLKRLQIKGGSFENIQCKLTGSSQILNSSNQQGLLDLSLFSDLGGNISQSESGDCYIRNNNNIKYIQFKNDKTSPIKISSQAPFQSLTNLERIYGNIQFKNARSLFSGLTKFSLHGSDNTGSLIIDGVTYDKTKPKSINEVTYNIIQTPLQLVSGESDSEQEWEHNQIISEYDRIYNIGIGALWQSGKGVTNISFATNVGADFSYIGYNTSLTQFDIYYLFNSFALSKVQTKITSFSYAFYSTNGRLNQYKTFKFSEGNQFNRYMFYGCSKITAFNSYIFPTSYVDEQNRSISLSGEHVLYPPTTDASGTVLYDNGLFSPLIDIYEISIYCANCYSNRFIFRRKQGKYNSLTTFNHQYFTLLQDDINNYKVKPTSSIVYSDDNYGSLEDVFKDTPNISSLLCVFDSDVINYSTIKIPTSMTSIVQCFNASRGKGEFVWGDVFDSESIYSKLQSIDNSFIISSGVDGNPVNFELYDTMLSNMPALRSLGYNYPDPTKNTNRAQRPTTQYNGTHAFTSTSTDTGFSVGFSGNGYNKILRNGVFPYNILQNLPNKKNLISFGGLFSYLTGNSLSANESPIRFPGTMFTGLTLLEDISALFMNATIPITLTSKGFKDCKYLHSITRLFYISESNSNGNILSCIPNNFFYIGESETSTINYYVADQVDYSTINVSDVISNVNANRLAASQSDPNITYVQAIKISDLNAQELSSNHLKIKQVTYRTPLKFITYAAECFYGQNNIKKYEWDKQGYNNLLYKNQYYIPDEHYINENTNQWMTRENIPLYTCEYDISNLYDGVNSITGCYRKDSDTIIINSTTNPGKEQEEHYICPPDLFSSFANTSDVSVRGFFKWCGYGGDGSHTPRRRAITQNYNFKGRICPYLFDSISNVSSLMEFFEQCKGIVSYQIQGDANIYMLPPTIFDKLSNLNNISKLMSGTFINTTINWPFTKLTRNTLDIRGLFAACTYSNDVSTSSIFNGLRLNNISGVFCTYLLTLTQPSYNNISSTLNSITNGVGVYVSNTIHQDSFRNETVAFSNNFSNSIIGNIDYNKYIYVGYPSTANQVQESSLTSILANHSLRNIGLITDN